MRANFRILLLMGAFSLFLLGISAVIYRVGYASLNESVIANSQVHATQITEKLQANFTFILEDLKLFAITAGLSGRDASDNAHSIPERDLLRHRFINFFETEYGMRLYESVTLTDTKGAILVTTGTIKQNYSRKPWWLRTISEGSAVTRIIGEMANRNISISIALYDDNGRVWGVMQALTSIPTLLRGGGLSLSGIDARQIDVITPDGEFLYSTALHSPSERITNQRYLENILTKDEFTHTPPSGHKELIIAKRHMRSTDQDYSWILVLHMDYHKVFGPILALRWWIITGLVAIVLAGLLGFAFLNRTITRPLQDIALAAARFGRQQYHARVTGRYSAEFAKLASTFNIMAQNIESSTARLNKEVEERRRAEHALEKSAAELKRSNEELEQFAYVASHDLQEPLRIIVSYIQLIERRYKDKLDEDGFRFMQATINGAERMRALIRGLLKYSRVSTQANPFEEVSLDAVLDEALDNLSESIKETQAQVEREPLPVVPGDHIQLVQLLQNLIGNALKFQQAGVPPVISISASNGTQEHTLSVADNGIGIEEQYTDRIFALFQRLHSRGKFPGTGIGLTVCKRIVERHAGSIWLEPNEGQGTIFYFTLAKGRNHGQQSQADSDSDGGG